MMKNANYISILTLSLVILLIMPLSILLILPQAEYVYYGVVPGRIYQYLPVQETDLSKGWYLNPATLGTQGYISILASKDDTLVRVYTLPGDRLVAEKSLKAMQKMYVPLPNGTMFKVVSNKLVSVLLISQPPGGRTPGVNATEGPLTTGFYLSVDGAYVGKEFVIETSQGLLGLLHTIFAIEDSEITMTAEDGSTQTFKLKANTYKDLQPQPFKAYRIVSTGNIMIQGGYMDVTGTNMPRSFFIPSAEGGFVGRRFYSGASETSDEGILKEENWFVISALEDTKVSIWDLRTQKLVKELNVKAGEPAYVKWVEIKVFDAIAFDSEKPVLVQFLHSGSIRRGYGMAYGAGLTYLGIRPNEETPFVLPTNSTIYAYLFSSDEANVYIDDVGITIRPDEPFVINTPGPHTIRSNKNIVLLLLHYPSIPPYQGINGFGVPVPCVQTISVTPSITLSPIGGGGPSIPVSYIIAIVILVVIIVIVIVFLRRKK
ncbi:MAG: hypothetical protein QXT26_00575 [Thermoproteota archaeon]